MATRAETSLLGHFTAAADAARRDAAARFARHGLPTVRDEAWKYTSLRALAEVDFTPAEAGTAPMPDLPVLRDLPDMPRLVFINGFYRADLSAPPAWATPGTASDLAQVAGEPFAALNTMFTQDGARLAVPAGMDAGTLLLLTLTIGDGAGGKAGAVVLASPRHRITLGAGATLSVLEITAGSGSYLHNAVLEVALGAGATLRHRRLQDEAERAFAVATLYADLAERATYDALIFTVGAALSRTEAHIALTGAGATLSLDAAQALAGRQHGDITTMLSHDAPQCRSRQTIRNVLDGAARGVFQGRIDVARAAQKTDGYQMNHALLLSPLAEIDSKPELRINADDVKCSHGATVGELDADQIFYLRSRGITEAEARSMLIHGFLAEPLGVIEDGPMRDVFDRALLRSLRTGAA